MLGIYKIVFYKNGLMSIYLRDKVIFSNGSGKSSFIIPGKDLDLALSTLMISAEKAILNEIRVRHLREFKKLGGNTALLSLIYMLLGKKIEIYDGKELVTGILLGLEENAELLTSQGVNKAKAILLSTEKGLKLIPLLKINELYIPEKEKESILSTLKFPEDTFEVELLFSGEAEEEILVSYVMRGKGWRPVYKIILTDNYSQLIAFTIISNDTAYDWVNVDLEFSTAEPIIMVPPPKPPLPAPREAGKPVAKTLMRAPEIEEATRTDHVGAGLVIQSFIVKNLTLRRGESKEIPLFTIDIDAEQYSEWLTHRREAERVLLLRNNSNYDLISGEASVFIDNVFIGLVTLKQLVSGGESRLHLGPDYRIRVDKTQQLVKKTTGLLRQGVKKAYETVFKVRNYSEDKIKLLIKDEPPEGMLKPEILNANISPVEYSEGLYVWRIELNPKQEIEIRFNYVYRE